MTPSADARRRVGAPARDVQVAQRGARQDVCRARRLLTATATATADAPRMPTPSPSRILTLAPRAFRSLARRRAAL